MTLSPKEIEVLTLVAMGYSDKQIGVDLKIAYGTVRNHIDRAVLKLNAQNRTHAAMIYKLMNKDWLEELYEENNNTLDRGTYYPSEYEKEHYHFLVDKDGKVHKGKFAPECNEVCRVGKYAAHTGGGNTGSIGVAICAMAGFKNKNSAGNYPITKKQFESTMELCAQLSKQYSIDILPQNVMTHYEFGIKNPKTTSAGKIDIIHIPPYSWVSKDEAGSFIRSKIKWYKLKEN